MHTVDLYDAPAYHAVSYMWGLLVPVYSILVNNNQKGIDSTDGPDKSGSLNVGKNLRTFLECFRRTQSNGNIYLWIDQLCIDQANTSERNHQVQLMSQIYTRAASTMVWLNDEVSPEDEEKIWHSSDLTSDLGASSPSFFNRFVPDRWKQHSPHTSPLTSPLPSPLPPAILEHRYFTRLWIIQENLLACDVNFAIEVGL